MAGQPQLLQPDGTRLDGRGLEEFRSIFLNTKVLNQAKGSAYLELGSTKVMVGVFGPRQSERKHGFSDTGRLQCEVRLTSFASKDTGRQAQMSVERGLSSALEQALTPSVQLDKLPKAVVDVQAMVLESGGSDMAALVTASSAALADAGIELYDLVPACKVVRLPGGSLLLDPTGAEEAAADGGVLLAQMPGSSESTALTLSGAWPAADSRRALELAMGGCAQLRAAMREVLTEAAAGGAGAEGPTAMEA